jgi:hypothetical protein
LFIRNNFYDEAKSIPGYPRPSNDYEWSIGFVRYFDWNNDCRNGAYSLDEVASKMKLSTPVKAAWMMFACTLFSVLITGVIWPVKYLKRRILEE